MSAGIASVAGVLIHPGCSESTRMPGCELESDRQHLLFLRPDVAAVKVNQRYHDLNGDLEGEGSPMYVLTAEDGRWLLTANQNTPVVAD